MKAIVCVDAKWGIGKKNDLLFHLPADMKFFRETTLGKVVIVGLNTLRSFPNGAPLPKRQNLVLSDIELPAAEGLTVCRSMDELLERAKMYPYDEVFVCGGASMYRQLLPYCSEALVTRVNADGDAEVFFPNLDADPSWQCVDVSPAVETNDYTLHFCKYINTAIRDF